MLRDFWDAPLPRLKSATIKFASHPMMTGLFRYAGAALFGILVVSSLAIIPLQYTLAVNLDLPYRPDTGEYWTLEQTRLALSGSQLSPGGYAALLLGLQTAAVLVLYSLAGLIWLRTPKNNSARRFALLLTLFAWASSGVYQVLQNSNPVTGRLFTGLGVVAFGSFFLLFYIFPDGRFIPRWTRSLGIIWLAWLLLFFAPDPFYPNSWPDIIVLIFVTLMLLSMGFAQIYRYHRVSNNLERQQCKWVFFSLFVLVGYFLIVPFLAVIFPSLRDPGTPAFFFYLISELFFFASQILVGAAIALAVLQRRLWDVDPLINRALVYAGLTISVISLYIFIVGYLGHLFRVPDNLYISLVATGVIAVIFQPLREWLQKNVNKLIYGKQEDPYQVITRLGARLESTLTPDIVVSTIVETVQEAFNIPYAALELLDGVGNMNLTAAAGKAPDSYDDLLNWGLNYRGEPLGQLILTPRSNGTPFSAADYRLLDELVRQAGAAIYTARLTGALKRSREQLVLAREEERRRLRNELHDSLGPRMAGLIMKIETARSLELQGSENTSMLDELSSLIRGTVASMRRVVRDLRPPTLDQLGLVPAILELQSICRPPEAPLPVIRADMPPSLPRLPAAVEVALYRIAQEALTNVIRHAQAQSCQMRLWVESAPAQVCLQIRDDGGGFPGSERIGVGLSSMRERAAELGGECLIESIPGRGTTITASIPLK